MHFLDKKASMNIFYQIEGKELVVPSKEDLRYLNCIFNNQEETLYNNSSNIKEETNQFFKRIIKKGSKTVVVLVTSLALFVTPVLAKGTINDGITLIDASNSVILYEQAIPSKGMDAQEIESLIKNNSNLSNEEKELALSCPEFFAENSKYFDKNLIANRLSNLETFYIKTKNGNVGGTYTSLENTSISEIRIYNCQSFEETQQCTWTHEFCHAFQDFDYNMRAFSEVLNTTINNEYFGVGETDGLYDSAYVHVRDYVYAILELIGDADFVREMYIKGGREKVAHRLVNIIPDLKMAYQTLGYLDILDNEFIYPSENKDVGKYVQNIERKLKNNLKKYYDAKTKKPLEDSLLMLYYLDKERFAEIVKKECELTHDITSMSIRKSKKYLRVDAEEKNYLNVVITQEYTDGYRYLTEEEILRGECGLGYSSKEEIDLPKMSDGTYKVPLKHFDAFEIALDTAPEIIIEEGAYKFSL